MGSNSYFEFQFEKMVRESERNDDDDELDINPPTPCQIGKRPPAPKPKRESAGHQGVAGGGYLLLMKTKRAAIETFGRVHERKSVINPRAKSGGFHDLRYTRIESTSADCSARLGGDLRPK